MRRLMLSVAVVVTLLIGIAAVHPDRVPAAQESTPADQHPLIGAWLADTDINDPANSPSLFIFHDDGTYLQLEEGASDGIGTWEATGPDAATLTIVFPTEDEAGAFVGLAKVRAAVVVDESGDSFSADYSVEFIGADGSSAGEMGPATATGERIVVEEMGTPVAPMPGAPEATPTT